MKTLLASMGLAALGVIAAVSFTTVASADDQGPKSEVWSLAQGGQLYDHWGKVQLKNMPDETHPAYPEQGKQKGASTWRCKECHGWDYRGKDGAYATGSHYTGIKGVRDQVGAPIEQIEKIMRNETHRYSEEMLSDEALHKLALFVSRGQLDMRRFIDYKTRKALGDPQRGERFFQTICAVCHGFDGKAINFKAAPKVEYIGTVANKNPQETLHKTINGQPGVPMIALRALDMQDMVDIVAYAQTLPVK